MVINSIVEPELDTRKQNVVEQEYNKIENFEYDEKGVLIKEETIENYPDNNITKKIVSIMSYNENGDLMSIKRQIFDSNPANKIKNIVPTYTFKREYDDKNRIIKSTEYRGKEPIVSEYRYDIEPDDIEVKWIRDSIIFNNDYISYNDDTNINIGYVCRVSDNNMDILVNNSGNASVHSLDPTVTDEKFVYFIVSVELEEAEYITSNSIYVDYFNEYDDRVFSMEFGCGLDYQDAIISQDISEIEIQHFNNEKDFNCYTSRYNMQFCKDEDSTFIKIVYTFPNDKFPHIADETIVKKTDSKSDVEESVSKHTFKDNNIIRKDTFGPAFAFKQDCVYLYDDNNDIVMEYHLAFNRYTVNYYNSNHQIIVSEGGKFRIDEGIILKDPMYRDIYIYKYNESGIQTLYIKAYTQGSNHLNTFNVYKYEYDENNNLIRSEYNQDSKLTRCKLFYDVLREYNDTLYKTNNFIESKADAIIKELLS